MGHSDVKVTIRYYYSYNPDDMPKFAIWLDDVDYIHPDYEWYEEHISEPKETEVRKNLVDMMYEKLFEKKEDKNESDDFLNKALLTLLSEEKKEKK